MQKTVLISGANRGIGRALAERFLEENYFVIGTSTSGKATLRNKNLEFIRLDLSSPKEIEKSLDSFIKLRKKIDILINNSGIWSGHENDPNMYVDALRKVLEVNLIGTIDWTEKLIPHLNKGAKIINISSRAGSFNWKGLVFRNYPDYRISKAALNMYTVTLANRLKESGILVASIHPGWVKTDMGGQEADLEPEVAAEQVYSTVISIKETGQFFFNNKKFPW